VGGNEGKPGFVSVSVIDLPDFQWLKSGKSSNWFEERSWFEICQESSILEMIEYGQDHRTIGCCGFQSSNDG
jgi:hypothetical protein